MINTCLLPRCINSVRCTIQPFRFLLFVSSMAHVSISGISNRISSSSNSLDCDDGKSSPSLAARNSTNTSSDSDFASLSVPQLKFNRLLVSYGKVCKSLKYVHFTKLSSSLQLNFHLCCEYPPVSLFLLIMSYLRQLNPIFRILEISSSKLLCKMYKYNRYISVSISFHSMT